MVPARKLEPAPARARLAAVAGNLRIAPDTAEFAINASNRRHWSSAVRTYIDDCIAGSNGEGGRDFNMRWIGSLVAEAYRILVRLVPA